MSITVRQEVLVSMPTRGRLWRLGDLRNMLEQESVAALDDDYLVIINEGNHGHSIRLLEPGAADRPPLTDIERMQAIEGVVGARQDWNLETRVESMDFSVRTYNLLKREDLHTIGALIRKSPNDLLDLRNFGQNSVAECEQKLALAGFSLRPNDE